MSQSMFTEMVTSTDRNWARKGLQNLISEHNAFANRLKEKKLFMSEEGGYEIVIPLEYAENQTYQRFTGYDPLNIDPSTIMTAAHYPWRQVAIHVTANGEELRKNSGKQRMINLVKARKRNALETAANNFAIDLYSDGSLRNQIGGLQYLIQTNGQGTVGGINSTNNSWWRNQTLTMPANTIAPWGSPTETAGKAIIKNLNVMWPSLVRGSMEPDMILMSNDMYNCLEETTEPLRRYAKEDTAKKGFTSIVYKNTEILRDQNANFASNAEKAFILNTDFFKIFYHPDANWTQEDEKRPVNQDSFVVPYLWMGNLVMTNRRQQGILVDAA